MIEAADAWARAMEAMAEAEEKRDEGYNVEEFERTEFALFKAVVLWRLRPSRSLSSNTRVSLDRDYWPCAD